MAPLGSRCAARRRRAGGGRRRSRCTARSLSSSTAISRKAASRHPSTRPACWRCSAAFSPSPRIATAPRAPSSRGPLVFALIARPGGRLRPLHRGRVPWLPSVARRPRLIAARQQAQQEAALIPILRQKLATLDQHSEQARQGYLLLGGAEARRRHDMTAAAEAWRTALGHPLRSHARGRDGRGDHRKLRPRHRRGRRPVPPRARRSPRPTRRGARWRRSGCPS